MSRDRWAILLSGIVVLLWGTAATAFELALRWGLSHVEAGAQGEHKLARGYLPAPTHSAHWVADPGFADAIGRYLHEEARAIDQEIEILTEYGPFRREVQDEHD
mgnify:CR=1 FL=1